MYETKGIIREPLDLSPTLGWASALPPMQIWYFRFLNKCN